MSTIGIPMCQCGCSNPYIEHAYELPNRQVVAYDVYHGCDQCFSGPGSTRLAVTLAELNRELGISGIGSAGGDRADGAGSGEKDGDRSGESGAKGN